MINTFFLLLIICVLAFLVAQQASIVVWSISYGLILLLLEHYEAIDVGSQIVLWSILFFSILLSILPLRRNLISKFVFNIVAKSLPTMSNTEREAIEAGTVSWEADLFSGHPDYSVLLAHPPITLSAEEQAFIAGPTKELCRMISDWDITHNRADLPKEIWDFIKENGFLGMIIPKEYGGLEFSATAQMTILVMLYGRSISVATTVAVPNSLGPAELLLKYGTEEQKNYYLPRLAKGIEIPCFALTGPTAGSDAASIPDYGIVCRHKIGDKEVVGMRLTWDKRYITLCPIATVIGLAFKLYDPENLLGRGVDLGISCALIPADTPGVKKGRRHFPLNIAFMNGPTQGKDVFVPLDYLIGGEAMIGKGWRMLMECLSAGRAISLPSSASGGAQAAALATGAYARIRKQFNQAIAKFEGIEEPLARIAGYTYIIDAALTMAVAAIDEGAKPAIVGAIVKYHTTELSRQIALDTMDIHGGKGICLGPKNYVGRGYQGTPIGITVEGANILSRSLIIFGQGAIRCHPYVLQEMETINKNDLIGFDLAFWGHLGFFMSNLVKSFFFNFTQAYMTHAPLGKTKRYYQLLNKFSSNLAFLADFSMMFLGASLKRREKISARLGDILSKLYLISAVLRRYYYDGENLEDFPIVKWSCQQLFHECELAIEEIIANFPLVWARTLLKIILQPFGKRYYKPSDTLGHRLAEIITSPNDTRTRLTRFAFAENIAACPVGQLEHAFQKICAVEKIEKKLSKAFKNKQITGTNVFAQIEDAKLQGILSTEEAEQIWQAELARQEAIAVDDFDHNELCRQPHENKLKKNWILEAIE